MTATTTTTIRSAFHREREAALTRWREAAHAVAAGGEPPSSRELHEMGSALHVTDPGRQLAIDAESIVTVDSQRRKAERVAAREREKLAPWGGDPAKLRAEIDRLKQRVLELEQIAYPACTADTHREATRAKNRSPLVWLPAAKVLEQLAERDRLEVEA